MKTDTMEFSTQRTVGELGRLLQQAMQETKAHSVEPVQSSSGALSAFDDRADIEIVAQGNSMLSGDWCVQVYVVDKGDERRVAVVALGDGGFTRAFHGARNTVSLSKSIRKRDIIAAAIR